MPPFVNTKCTHAECGKPNRFDLAELRRKDGVTYKGFVLREVEEEEFSVPCQHCGRLFKFKVPPSTEARRDAKAD
jgi:hypothetical protein